MSEHSFPKSARLLTARDFDRVFAARISVANPWITIHAASNNLAEPRLGLAVSRRCGSAVVRNRWKRLLREAFRLSRAKLPPLDLVCVPKQSAAPPLPQIMGTLVELALKAESKCRQPRSRSARTGDERGR